MNRYFRILLILCLILFASSCNANNVMLESEMKNENGLSSSNTSETQAITESNEYFTDPSHHSEPSRTLYFDSIACYHEFMESVYLDKKEFELYIKKNNFHMNGIQTKEDVTKWINEIELLPVPASTSYEFVSMVIDVDFNTLFMSYQCPEDGGCTFLIYFDKNDYLESSTQYNDADQETRKISMDEYPDIQSLYVINDDDSSFLKAYLASINGYNVLVRTYNMPKESILPVLSSFTFDYSEFFANMQ